MSRFNTIKIDNTTLFIDNTIINMLEILKLARESQLKIESKASKKYFNNHNTTKTIQLANKLATENIKTEYLEYLIKQLEKQ